MYSFFKLSLVALLGINLVACGTTTTTSQASETTDAFFNLLKEQKQDEALALMDEQMRAAVTPMLDHKGQQGSLTGFEKLSEDTTSTELGKYWTLNYKSTYEKKDFYEEFEVTERGDSFVIIAYRYDTHPFEETKAKTKQVETFVSTVYELQSTSNYIAILEMIDEEALENTTSAEWEMILMNKQTIMGRFRGFDPSPREFQRGEYEDGTNTFTAGFLVSYEKGELYEKWTLINRGHNFKILSHEYADAASAIQ